MPFHSPLQLRALVVYTLLVVLSPQRVSQGLLYPPRGLIHTLFASPLDGTVSSSFKRLVSFASVTEANFRSMALPVPPGYEAFAALAPAPAAPEVIIFSFIFFSFR